MIKLVSLNLNVCFNQFKLYDNNAIMINELNKNFLHTNSRIQS